VAAPALAVSFILGSLYAFFAMAPAILMAGFHFSPFGLGVFFASTVFVVFGAGFLAPRLAHRWGQVQAARIGIVVALAGGSALLLGKEDFVFFSASLAIFLLGMGVANPLGTAIALQPFGRQAGAASALLGFLQMGCAALAISVSAMLGVPAYTALGIILTSSLILAFVAFLALRQGPQ
ncbi:MAG TPA: Bcr/CflA family drug resistance efflux transporter, partial [Pusillimonas sp.]|nr:Bcr/CflA family drug resistance efflux transporter [Pusillimonas sp.]